MCDFNQQEMVFTSLKMTNNISYLTLQVQIININFVNSKKIKMKNKILMLIAFATLGLTFATLAQVPNYIPTNGLVGYWPFNGNANDESGNGNHGTVNGATLTSDRFGNINKAYSFDGTTSYIQCQNAGPTGNPVITFTCWVKTASTNYGNIISYGGNSQSGQDFRVFINGNCPNSFAFDTYDNQKAKVSTFNNSWDFYCVLYDGGIGNNTTVASFYKNGILMTTECFNVNISSTNISNLIPITFGKYHGTLPANPTGFYDGVLDDIGIWNRALTQQEITALYLSGQPCPSIATIQGPNNVNIGNTITLTDSTVNGTWSSSNTTVATINSNGVVTGHTVGTTIISYIATTSCGLDTATYAITVNANPCLPNYVPTNGLVGWWPFCGNANDESWNGNNGTVYGASLTVDRNGNANSAYSFDGVTNKIIVSNSSGFNFQSNNSFSVSYWLKLTTFSGTVNIAFDKQSSLGNSQVGWNSFIEPNNYTNFYLHNGFGGLNACNYGLIQVSQWFHIVQTWGNNIANVYLNGQLIGSTQYTDVVGDNLENLIIGNSDFTPPGTGINGLMDDIGIWNRALTQQEITSLYLSSQPCPSIATIQGPNNVNIGNTITLTDSTVNGTWSSSNTTVATINPNGVVTGHTIGTTIISYIATTPCGLDTATYAITVNANPCLPNYIPTNGLVGYWPFCGNANDESGNGNNGTVNGATLTNDRNGNANSAFVFNGSSSTINCSNSSIPKNSSFSISFWVKPTSVSGIQEFFHQNVWPGAFYVGMNGGYMRCGDYWQNTGVYVNPSQWQHFIIVRNYMNNVEIYLNGTLQTSLGTDIILGGSATDPLVFGKQYGSNGEFYNGILDDIGIWNRALTQQEITALYTSSSTPTCTFSSNHFAQDTFAVCGSSYTLSAGTGYSNYNWNTGATTSSITVTNSGWYKCTVSNSTGCTASDSVYVSLVNVNILQNDTTVCAGTQLSLNAASTSSSSASICSSSALPSNLQQGLVGYWPFCGNANDASGNGNNGTVNGATLTTDRFGNVNSAYSFDGVNDEISANIPLLPIGNSNRTLVTWINTNVSGFNYNNSHPYLGTIAAYGNSAGGNVIFPQMIENNNFKAYFESGSSSNQLFSNTAINNGDWHCIVTTFNGLNVKMYIDGVLNATTSNITLITANSVFGIGYCPWANIHFQGKIDDISIYNRALTSQEITQLYNIGNQTTTYLWSTGDTTANINVNPTQTTTYYCTVSNGITSCTDSVTVTVNPLPTNIFAQDTIAACGSSYTLSASAGYSNYNWNTGATTSSIAVNNSGWYTCSVTNNLGCAASDSIYLTINPLPTVTANASATTVCAGNWVTLTGGGANTYAWSGGITNGVSFVPTATTTYTVTGTDVNGCTNTATQTITVNALPTVTANASATTVCAGNTVTLTGGGANTYTWTGGITNGVSFVPTATTTYTVTGIDVNGCTNTATQTITVNALPMVTANASATTVCAGTSVTLTGGGANTYTWTGGVTNGVSFVPTATTTYTVTGTDVNGCTNTATKTITVNALPTVTANASATTVCAGTSVTLTGGGANTYAWSGGITNGVSFVPTATTIYTVTGTDVNGCTNTATQTITVNALPIVIANASATTVCTGNSVTLTGGGANTYTWTGGVTNGISFVPTATTIYTVTGTDVNGCTNTATQTITVNALPTVTANASATTVCAGNTVTLTSGGANTYTWSGGVTNGVSFVPTATTTYTVTGTDVNGCTNTATQTIAVNALPTVTANASATTVCAGTSVTLTGGGANAYTWTGGVTNGISFVPTASTTYTVTGTDVNGCTNTATINIGLQTASSISVLNTTNASCNPGCDGTATMDNIPNMVYSIIPAVIPPIVGNNISGLCSGTTYTITGTSSVTGCTSTTSVTIGTVSGPVAPTILSSTPASCNPGCNGIVILYSPVTMVYSVSPSGPLVTGNKISALCAGTVYTVTGTDVNGCTVTTTISVGTYPNPPAPTSVVTSNATCVPGCDGVVTMSPPIDLTYTVSPGGTAIANVIEGLCDGVIYTVTGTDIMGCTATTTISVGSQTASPISVLNTTNASCNAGCDGTATMSNVLNMTYSINPSVIPPIVGNVITGLCAGTTYTITGTSSVTGCTSTTTLTISSNPLPTVTANASATTVCAGNTVTLTGGGANTYTWSGGVTNGVSFVPTTTTTYTVTGTDVNGCTNTATKTITVNALPILVISASKQLYCEKDTVGILTGNPIGGVWSGVGVSGNTFNPTVAGLGSFYVVYTYTATNGCTNKDSLLMKVTSCLGVDDVSDENLFSVYPNPTTSEINVKTDVQLIGSDFVLYDNAGNVLRRGKIKSENTLIKLSDYSAGVYYFTVVNPLYGKHSIKVIKE